METISFEDIPYSLLGIDKDGNIVSCNAFVEQLTGFEKSELIGKKVEELLPDELAEKHLNFRKHYQFGSGTLSGRRDIEIKHKYHQTIHCTIKLIEHNNGYVAFLDESSKCSNKDIINLPTLYSSQSAQTVLNGIEEAFWEWNIEQDIIHYSSQAMAILGYEKKAFSGPTSMWEEHLLEKDLQEVYRQVGQHFAGNISCINATYPVICKKGRKKWITIVGKVFEYKNGQPSKMFGSVKDVSDSHSLIFKLRKQNSYLQLAEKLNSSGHWHIDLKTNDLYWSKGIYDIHSLNRDSYIPSVENAINFYIESEREVVKQQLEQAIANKKGFYFKSIIVNALGKKVKIETLGEVELDSLGNVIGLFGVFRDISKSEELFEKLKLLAMVNYTIKVPIFFIDEQDNVVYQDLSPQIGNENSVLFNYINFSIKDYLKFKRIAKSKGQYKETNVSFDKYNSVFDLSVTYEAGEGIFIWIVENVTEKFRKDQQQIISNRLALLGNTFGNVSHDINNVLGVALGATEMLELKFSKGDKDISTYIERVKNAIDKGKSVTERLLAFTRKPNVKVVEFDPIQDLRENVYLFEQLLLNTIEFSFKAEETVCSINFPKGEYINILLNLVLNAQDAIKEKGLNGKIEIIAKVVDNNRFEVHVKDSGIGIEPHNLTKIFDPFYSSKSINKGNGIGLANVYSTMYKYNGEIQVSGDSDLGGAEFKLVFKCRTQNMIQPTIEKNQLTISGQSVLILDDEISIAEFVALYLEHEGAITQHACNKSELLEILASNQHFDIFITDMILPDISGGEAVQIVLGYFPDINVYSMSGYIGEEDKEWPYPVLRKPFNSKELALFLQHN